MAEIQTLLKLSMEIYRATSLQEQRVEEPEIAPHLDRDVSAPLPPINHSPRKRSFVQAPAIQVNSPETEQKAARAGSPKPDLIEVKAPSPPPAPIIVAPPPPALVLLPANDSSPKAAGVAVPPKKSVTINLVVQPPKESSPTLPNKVKDAVSLANLLAPTAPVVRLMVPEEDHDKISASQLVSEIDHEHDLEEKKESLAGIGFAGVLDEIVPVAKKVGGGHDSLNLSDEHQLSNDGLRTTIDQQHRSGELNQSNETRINLMDLSHGKEDTLQLHHSQDGLDYPEEGEIEHTPANYRVLGEMTQEVEVQMDQFLKRHLEALAMRKLTMNDKVYQHVSCNVSS